MSATPPNPSDGDGNGPVEPAQPPLAGTALPGAGAGGPRNGAGVGALVCGVLAVLSIAFFPLGVLVFGVAAVVLGVMGVRRAKRAEATNQSQATAGLVAGIVAVVGFVVLAGTFYVQNREEVAEFNECLQAASSDEEEEQCRGRLEEDIGR